LIKYYEKIVVLKQLLISHWLHSTILWLLNAINDVICFIKDNFWISMNTESREPVFKNTI